jgi:hypothetical protein
MTIYTDIIEYAISKLEDMGDWNGYQWDMHHILFNEDYFIIGRYEASRWLERNPGIFEAISEIREFEEQLGGFETDVADPEKVANMFCYIQGFEVLRLSETWRLVELQDKRMNDQHRVDIIAELQEALKQCGPTLCRPCIS